MTGKLLIGLILSGYILSAHAQTSFGGSYWQQIRSKGDSIVIKHFGESFFNDHIFFDPEYEINYIAFGNGYSCAWHERDTVTTIPEFIHFEYLIGFDEDEAVRTIEIAFHPDGTLVPPTYEPVPSIEEIKLAKEFSREVLYPLQEFYGFIDCAGQCSFKYDLNGFLALARKNRIKCKRKDVFLMQWISPDSISWANGQRKGHYELVVPCRVGREKIRSDDHVTTYLIFQNIVFDPFTGKTLRTYLDKRPKKLPENLCDGRIRYL